jgi:hypothetical protein
MTVAYKPVAKKLVDVLEVQHFYNLLVEPGQVVEVRALDASLTTDKAPYDKPRTMSGYFTDVDKLTSSIARISSANGIYMTINPCPDALLARANNRLNDRKVAAATSDDQIVKRRILFLDLDPERERGVTGIPTNEREHQIALERAQYIRDNLLAGGWPAPLEIDSGNGAYLVYAIDVPAQDDGLIQRVLAGLAKRFDIDAIHIDQTAYNSARIMRLPGTWNCKGDGTPDRPHRQARIMHAPDTLLPVDCSLLEDVAVPAQLPQEHTETSKKQHTSKFSVSDFLSKYDITVLSSSPYKGGTRYALAECPFCHETDHNACAYDTSTGPGFSCSHNRCDDKEWHDFRAQFDKEYAEKDKNTADKTQKEEKSAEEKQPKEKRGPTTQELLREIAKTAEYIVTPSGDLYACVPVNSHHEVVPINERGSGFRRWLVYQFDKLHGHAPNSEAISQVMSSVQAKAAYEGKKAKVHTRIAEYEGNIYLDLANDQWKCVKITPAGWGIIKNPPVYFRRPAGMLPLPIPLKNGNIDDLRTIINTKDDKNYKLMLGWLIGAMHPTGPYPVLNFNGERGSAKSKTTATLRNLIDPNEAPTRDVPKDKRDGAIAAQNTMVFALDNLSSMPLWLSDFLCRLSTGSGSATRALYTDDGEKIFSAARPIIINGIEDSLISQGDLLNRTMLVKLKPPERYKTEEEIDELFREKHPGILGALLTLVSVALRERKSTYIKDPPRMADFVRWVTATETGMNIKQGETFLEIYRENQKNAESIVIEASPLALAITRLIEKSAGKWEGLISGLYDELMKDSVYSEGKEKLPKRLSGPLERITPSLRPQGIDITLERIKKGNQVTIKQKATDNGQAPKTDPPKNGVEPQAPGVEMNPNGVVGVEPQAPGVETKHLSTQHPLSNESASEADSSKTRVDGVEKIPVLSAFSSQNEHKTSRPDNEGIFSTPSTPDKADSETDITHVSQEVYHQLADLEAKIKRNVLYQGAYLPPDEYFNRLKQQLSKPDEYEGALYEIRRQLKRLEVPA